MPEHKVTSEIYSEHDYKTLEAPTIEGNVISKFSFVLPLSTRNVAVPKYDEDDDLDVERPQKDFIKIEHSVHTSLSLVGRQVWRGALLLADLVAWQGRRGGLGRVLELGAGTGLAGIAAAMFADSVVCTDIDQGGILELIAVNARHNARLLHAELRVLPLDFTAAWSPAAQRCVAEADVVLAADVIYDDDVTAAFVSTMQKVLNTNPPKTLYLALEKRFVFTIEHMESVAPCYETFLSLLDKVKSENMHSKWHVQQIDTTNIPQYFTYDRVKELVLWQISSTPL